VRAVYRSWGDVRVLRPHLVWLCHALIASHKFLNQKLSVYLSCSQELVENLFKLFHVVVVVFNWVFNKIAVTPKLTQYIALNINRGRPIQVHLFGVFVERLHLLKYLVCDLVERRHLIRGDGHFDVVQSPDYWLELRIVDTVQRFYYLQILFMLFVFFYGCLDWGKVLLVTYVDVI